MEADELIRARYAALESVLDERQRRLYAAVEATGLAKFMKTLQSHRSGICAYADHQITAARLEPGNVSIGLLRRRARSFHPIFLCYPIDSCVKLRRGKGWDELRRDTRWVRRNLHKSR